MHSRGQQQQRLQQRPQPDCGMARAYGSSSRASCMQRARPPPLCRAGASATRCPSSACSTSRCSPNSCGPWTASQSSASERRPGGPPSVALARGCGAPGGARAAPAAGRAAAGLAWGRARRASSGAFSPMEGLHAALAPPGNAWQPLRVPLLPSGTPATAARLHLHLSAAAAAPH